jgi:hypothetical protein
MRTDSSKEITVDGRRLQLAAIEVARTLRGGPRLGLLQLLPTVAVVVLLAVQIGAAIFLKANQPPPGKRAFETIWRCEPEDLGGVCERLPPPKVDKRP